LFDITGYVYRAMKTSSHTTRLHAPYAVFKLFLILHCVLSFNHFMTSPLVCRSVENFDNLRIFSTQSITQNKGDKRQAKQASLAPAVPAGYGICCAPALHDQSCRCARCPGPPLFITLQQLSSIRLIV
jgi:hypothetical protein